MNLKGRRNKFKKLLDRNKRHSGAIKGTASPSKGYASGGFDVYDVGHSSKRFTYIGSKGAAHENDDRYIQRPLSSINQNVGAVVGKLYSLIAQDKTKGATFRVGASDARQETEVQEDYVDPILFAEGIYADQADYERTIDELASNINAGTATKKGREESAQ